MTDEVCSVCGSPTTLRFNGVVLQAPICYKCEKLFACGSAFERVPTRTPEASIDLVILYLISKGVMDPAKVISKEDPELKL